MRSPGTATAAGGRVLGANDRIRFGLIGGGSRGKEILQAAIKCPNVEAAAVADIYTRRFDEVKAIVPGIATFKDYRALLDDKTIDAVLIATPQHLHVIHFVAAIQAGKDVYQEKTMAFNPGHARRMRAALTGSGRVVQIGMQMNSGEGIQKVRELAASESLGTLTLLETHHFRNRPYGGWLRQIPADCDPEHVDWAAFQGEAKHVPFDPQRYINWRFFWDYSGGNVFENMVHTLGFLVRRPRPVDPKFRDHDRRQLPLAQDGSAGHVPGLDESRREAALHLHLDVRQQLLRRRARLPVRHQGDLDSHRRRIGCTDPARRAQRSRSRGPSPTRATKSTLSRTCRTSSTACATARSPSARSSWASAPRSLARWPIASYRRQATVRWDPATEEII